MGPKPDGSLYAMAVVAPSGMLGLAAAETDDGGNARIAAAVQPFVEDGTVAGVVALAADTRSVLSLDAVGYADLRAQTAMRPDTLFWIASQSKPFTATALMKPVDEDKANWDDPVETYLPEFVGQVLWVQGGDGKAVLRKPSRPITDRRILTHSSGLPDRRHRDRQGDPPPRPTGAMTQALAERTENCL